MADGTRRMPRSRNQQPMALLTEASRALRRAVSTTFCVRKSKVLVPAKCRLIVLSEFEGASKRYRVFQCLSRALPCVRQHGMCGVSEQSDASFSPNWYGIAIKQFVESDVLGASGSNDRLKSLIETGADTMRDFQRLQRAPSNVVGRHG